MATRPIIALLTDFGEQDAYVASMKGVILGILPDATIVDITHAVPAQDIHAGGFLLDTCVDAFPPATTYLCVVDPGVGTTRNALVLRTPLGTFVGPDNGLFSYILTRHGATPGAPAMTPPAVTSTATPNGVAAHHTTNRTLLRPQVSHTFHGRDVFAPIAAHLAAGLAIDQVGQPAATLQAFQPLRPVRDGDETVTGHVVHVDRYGNLITNLREPDLPLAPVFEVAGHAVVGLSASYQDASDLLAVIGSNGYLELAAPNGSAAERLGIGRWGQVTCRPRLAPVPPPPEQTDRVPEHLGQVAC